VKREKNRDAKPLLDLPKNCPRSSRNLISSEIEKSFKIRDSDEVGKKELYNYLEFDLHHDEENK